jgi:hypothetical protein
MKPRPAGEEPTVPTPRTEPTPPPAAPGTLKERMEETRLKVEALEREVAGVIAGNRSAEE